MLTSFDQSGAGYADFVELERMRHVRNPQHRPARAADLSRIPHRLFLQSDAGRPTARVAAMVTDRRWRGRRIGMLGLYEACEHAPYRAIRQLLDAACGYLAEHGCGAAIGPINGSTWYDYRFAVPGGGNTFFMDTANPDEYPGQWLQAGFAPVEHYRSTVIERVGFSFGRLEKFGRRLQERGICVEPVCAQTFTSVLPEIHQLCLHAFAANPFFSEIGYAAFADLYQLAGAILDPRWALAARDGTGRLVGFAFAFPDLLDQARRSLVVKTVAVRQDGSARGLGAWLTERLHRNAWEAGFDRIYHALMHDANSSVHIHRASARPYRSYVLLGREL